VELYEFHELLTHPSGLLWAEKTAQQGIEIKVSPSSMDYFTDPLFAPGAVFTSGTLAQLGSCRPFAERLRLDVDTAREAVLSTPFPLAERTRVYVSKGTDPKSSSYEADLEREILALLDAGEKKTFVLFSSLKLMNSLYMRIERQLRKRWPDQLLVDGNLKRPVTPRRKASPSLDADEAQQPIRLWLQDKYNKDKVIQSFENPNERSILFGSLSFFEGIDLRGEALTQVILTRLPFAHFEHPIQQILNQHANYSEWEAVLRLEQAYGRIMRGMKDYGTFAVLDRRIVQHPAFMKWFEQEQIPVVTEVDEVATFYERLKSQ
jgi:ATP-dependent DNA helicase DinG